MVNPFSGFNWKYWAEMIGAAAGIGAVTFISDSLAKCQSGLCHAMAPAAGAVLAGILVWLRAIQQQPPAPWDGTPRRAADATPPPEAK